MRESAPEDSQVARMSVQTIPEQPAHVLQQLIADADMLAGHIARQKAEQVGHLLAETLAEDDGERVLYVGLQCRPHRIAQQGQAAQRGCHVLSLALSAARERDASGGSAALLAQIAEKHLQYGVEIGPERLADAAGKLAKSQVGRCNRLVKK
jgi:hypothetical protein